MLEDGEREEEFMVTYCWKQEVWREKSARKYFGEKGYIKQF